jgi:hypothetical protein
VTESVLRLRGANPQETDEASLETIDGPIPTRPAELRNEEKDAGTDDVPRSQWPEDQGSCSTLPTQAGWSFLGGWESVGVGIGGRSLLLPCTSRVERGDRGGDGARSAIQFARTPRLGVLAGAKTWDGGGARARSAGAGKPVSASPVSLLSATQEVPPVGL